MLRRRDRRRRGQHVAAGDLARHRRQVDRHALARGGALDGLVVDLHAAHARARPAGSSTQPRRRAPIVPDHSVPVTHRAGAVDRERRGRRAAAPGRASSAPGVEPARPRGRAPRHVLDPAPVRAEQARPRASGKQLARLRDRAAPGRRRSAFVIATTPRSHPERPQHRQRARASGASRRRRRRRRAGTGRSRSRRRPSCARSARARARRPPTSRAAAGQRERRVAQLDRDPARAAPRAGGRCRRPVSARTSAVLPWSMCPAVPSVSGTRRSRRAALTAAAATSRLLVGRACAGRAAAARRGCGATTGGSPARSARARVAPALPGRARPPGPVSSSSGSAPPPTFARRPRRPRRRSPSRQRARPALAAPRRRPSSIASTGISRARALGVAVERAASPPAPPARACRSAARGRAGGARAAPTASRACRRSAPACGPPSSLSPLKHTSAAPAAHRAAHRGLLGQQRRASSASTPEPTSSITGTPSPHSASIATSSTKPERAEVRRVRAQDRAGARRPARARSRRRRVRFVVPTSTQPRAGLRHHLGDPERRRRSRPAARARRRPRARRRRAPPPPAAPRRRSC